MTATPLPPAEGRPRTDGLDRFVLGLVAALVLVAVVAPAVAPATAYESDILNALQPPGPTHWLGTDGQGRDVLWRVLVGASVSIGAAILIVALYALIGTLVALLAAAGPPWLDATLMRVTDIGMALPGMVVALGFAASMGPSLRSAIIAMAITGWPISARILRGVLRQTMSAPFVEGAIVLGVPRLRLMTRHVLPNALDILVVKWAGDISTTVLLLGGLSFIGVGAQPPSAEWGAMVADARGYVTSAWWVAAAPGLAIALTSIAFGLLGDQLRQRLDPSASGS